MSGFDLSHVPIWVWILVAVVFIATVPTRLKVLGRMFRRKDGPGSTGKEKE